MLHTSQQQVSSDLRQHLFEQLYTHLAILVKMSVCLCVSFLPPPPSLVSLPLCVSVSVFVSVSVSVCLYVCLSVYLSACLYVCLPLPPSLSLSLSVGLSLSLCLSLYHSPLLSSYLSVLEIYFACF